MQLNSSMDRWASSSVVASCHSARKSLISWLTGSKDKSNVHKSRCLPRSSYRISAHPLKPAVLRWVQRVPLLRNKTRVMHSAQLVLAHAISMLPKPAWKLSTMRMVMWLPLRCQASPSIQVFSQERWPLRAPPCLSSCSRSSTVAKPSTQRSNSQSSTLSWTSKCKTWK